MNNVVDIRGKEIPKHLQDPLNYITGSCCLTPDFKELRNSLDDFFLVFVWDDVQQDHLYHGYVEDGAYFGRAVTNLTNFTMRLNPQGNTPLVFQGNNHKLGKNIIPMFEMGRIRGEVYAIPLRALADLDLIMFNTEATEREEVWVTLRDCDNRTVKVWMYLNRHEYFDKGNNEILHMKACKAEGYGQYQKIFYYQEPVTGGSAYHNQREPEYFGYMGLDENIYI